MKDKHWKIYTSKIEKRVDNLLKNKFYFEVVFLNSNILEVELKDLINEHQRACKYILKKEKIKFYPKRFFDPDKKTLGELKKYISSFVKNKHILKEIENFNKLRIKTIHKLFDQNLRRLEQEIVKSIPRFHKLMEGLVDIKIAIIIDLQIG
jgi:uncharacterized protein with HEPN domain